MRKTHKKILGFAGLGLVAAATTVAAVLPTPRASAVANFTDVIQVRVMSDDSDITISTDSDSEITTSQYQFTVDYNSLASLKITVKNFDSEGNLTKSTVIYDRDDLNYGSGTENFDLNLDDYGGHGYYTIFIDGVGQNSVPIEKTLSVRYKTATGDDDGGEVNPEEGSPDVVVDVDVPTAEVKSVEINIYDDGGNLVKTINLTDPNAVETLDLSDLPDGTYTMQIISRDTNNDVIKVETRVVVIDRDGTGAEVNVEIQDPGEEIGKAVITVTDDEGNVVKRIEIDNPNPGDIANINLDDLGPGSYDITVEYYDPDGNLIRTDVIPVIKSDTDGKVDVPLDDNVDVVEIIEVDIYDEDGNLVRVVKIDTGTGIAYVYDKDGNLLFTIPNAYKDGKILISFDDLVSGNYTAVIKYLDGNGKVIGNTKTIKVKYVAGKAIIVPDTGSFFQGLNISREDYLITGIIAFAIIGVVAFGVMKRNHSTKKINGRNRR